ncbi:MAG: dipeptide epimerase, partial [Planctomycetia bacterium]
LESVRDLIEAADSRQPEALWEDLQAMLPDAPFAQCAVDCAAYDLWGKLLGRPVWQLWDLDLATCPVSNYTIGIDTIEVMLAKMDEFPGWPVYKVKLGTKEDIEIVRALRAHTDAIFRVDANCGWTADETIHNAPILKELGVEFIEQPLPADAWDDMKRVYAESVLPVIADESCRVESDVTRCYGCFHGVNVKLTKCGGLTPGRRMVLEARRLGMKVMVGCMVESSVGIAAIAQILPLLDYVDMDGALLLNGDVANGVTIEKGHVSYPDRPGSGIELLDGVF